MLKRTWFWSIVTLVSLLVMVSLVAGTEEDSNKNAPPAVEKVTNEPASEASDTEKSEVSDTKETVVWKPAVEPKPLSDQVQKGLDWLIGHQLESGAWGQGEESSQMQGSSNIFIEGAQNSSNARSQTQQVPSSMEKSKSRVSPDSKIATENKISPEKSTEIPSVADTCMATLALIRAGNTPSKGPFAKNVHDAVTFICSEIEVADEQSPYITKTRGTRVQSKLGPYIDTFMAAMLLPEVLKQMPDEKENQRVKDALAKVLKKMELHQREDGTWSDSGWAAALAQGAAVKGLNRAMQSGMEVPQQMQQRAEGNARQAFDAKAGSFKAGGSAGVDLYASSSSLSALADSVNSNEQQEKETKRELAEATTEEQRDVAKRKLQRFDEAKKDLDAQQEAVVEKLADEQFIAGFGNNGGEEFLSYMNIGESLVVKGDNAWLKWDESITKNLNNIQNQDGSWSGHHCITGRTFCTSAALLVLMVDRAPFPVSGKVKRQQ